MAVRHFLSLTDLTPDELDAIVRRGMEFRRMHEQGVIYQPYRGRVLAMIFEQSSTRTRTAFEAGMAQLGGHAIFMAPEDTHLGRGEPPEDAARVLSEMVDIVMIRTTDPETIGRFASAAGVPVINAMTSREHPCQILADVQTYAELRGTIRDRQVAFIGDGYNMCNSFIIAADQFGFDLRIATPPGYAPDPALVRNSRRAQVFDDPREALRGVDLVVTDVWSSMGHESEQAERRAAFEGFQITPELLDLAAGDALLMHCLPAHRGEEVSAAAMLDPRAVVWREAGNRLHSQKALLEFLLEAGRASGDR